MFPILEIGPLAIKADGFFLVIGLMTGLWLTKHIAKNLNTDGDTIENGLLTGLVAGLAGARIGFLLQNPSFFLDNPLSLISLSPSMLNVTFGLLIGILALWIFLQRKHLPLWPTLDTISPMLITLFGGIQLANLAVGSGYGFPTELPWGIQLWDKMRHPTQIYGLIGAAAVGALLLNITQSRMFRQPRRSGVLFLLTSSGLSFVLIGVRGFVADKNPVLGLDPMQILAFLLLTASLWKIYQKQFGSPKKHRLFISLGSNQNPCQNLDAALTKLKSQDNLLSISSFFQTKGVKGQSDAPDFINAVVEIESDLNYPKLRKALKQLEKELGRNTNDKSQVAIDLDILTFDQDVFVFEGKSIPDPDITNYLYILMPLQEIAPHFRHPATGIFIDDLIKQINSKEQKVTKIESEDNHGD